MIRPMGPRVLVLPDPEEKAWSTVQTAQGEAALLKPETSREKPQQGTVVAVGPNVEDVELVANGPGTRVIYGKFSGSEIEVDGKEMLILREDEILGKVIEAEK